MVCLPGVTRTARDFTALAEQLSVADDVGPAMRVITIESRGRGRSDRSDASTYTVKRELTDILGAFKDWGVERAKIVGTSRGGLLAMIMAMVAPERMAAAVLNDIGPQIEAVGLSRIAATVGVKMHYPSFEAVGAELEERLTEQFPRLEGDMWVRLAKQLARPAKDGGVELDYDPALSEGFQAAADAPSPDFWPAFDALCKVPVMVIRGAHSDLLSAATVEAMRRRHRALETFVAEGEGHAPLLWDRRSIEAVKRFVAR
ncbi:MAG: alpha/beta hydrolase [Pseudomonadota bacterium]